jgi:hypothetical protein
VPLDLARVLYDDQSLTPLPVGWPAAASSFSMCLQPNDQDLAIVHLHAADDRAQVGLAQR